MGVPTPCLCRFDSGVMVAGVMRSLRLGGLLGSPILTKRELKCTSGVSGKVA